MQSNVYWNMFYKEQPPKKPNPIKIIIGVIMLLAGATISFHFPSSCIKPLQNLSNLITCISNGSPNTTAYIISLLVSLVGLILFAVTVGAMITYKTASRKYAEKQQKPDSGQQDAKP